MSSAQGQHRAGHSGADRAQGGYRVHGGDVQPVEPGVDAKFVRQYRMLAIASRIGEHSCELVSVQLMRPMRFGELSMRVRIMSR
jgi:hypothetical protein